MRNRMLFALAVLLPHAVAAQQSFARVDSVVVAEMTRNGIPGVAIAIVQGDRVVYAKGFGVANAETRAPVTADMLFRISSVTKMFTGLTAAQLAIDGMKLDAPISTYDKALAPAIGRLTMRQLLSHQSGLRDGSAPNRSRDDSGLANGARSLNATDFFTTPGSIYSYSNLGFMLAGHAEARFAHMTYAETVEAKVLRPLGMTTSTYDLTAAVTHPLAVGHKGSDSGVQVIRPLWDAAAMQPRGGLFSSANELGRFVIAFMNHGRIDGKQAIPARAVELMMTPNATVTGDSLQYGMGLRLHRNGVLEVGHYGGSEGFGSYIRMLPDQRIGVIVLTNRTNGIIDAVADSVFAMLAGVRHVVATRPLQAIPRATFSRYAGRYVNGDQTIVLEVRGEKLCLIDDDECLEVMTRGPGNLVATSGGAAVQDIAVTPVGGQIEYVFMLGRAFRTTFHDSRFQRPVR